MRFSLILISLFGVIQAGTPQGAERIVAEYEQAMTKWQLGVQQAQSKEALQLQMQLKPDLEKCSHQLLREIGADLQKPWTLKYSGWVIEHYSGLTAKDTKFLIQYAEKFHLKSPDLPRFCLSVVYAKAPLEMKKVFLQNAMKNIEAKSGKGLAALALSQVLSNLGAAGENAANRLKLLRYAIIHSADVKIDDTTAGELIKEELYRIKHLSKGRVAPELTGIDSAGLPLKLSSYKGKENGKVVMLVFWSSFDHGAGDEASALTLKMLNRLKKFEQAQAGKRFALLGVNRDSLADLRKMEQAGVIAGKTFSDPQRKLFQTYRVQQAPFCFVLDDKGVIQYVGGVGSFAELTVDALLNPASEKMP